MTAFQKYLQWDSHRFEKEILHSAHFSVVLWYPAHSSKYSLNLKENKWNFAQLELQCFNLTTKGMTVQETLCGIHPNGWCKMLCCLATCLIICRRDLTESLQWSMLKGILCACVYTCLWLWVYSMLYEACCQLVTDCPSPVKGGRG